MQDPDPPPPQQDLHSVKPSEQLHLPSSNEELPSAAPKVTLKLRQIKLLLPPPPPPTRMTQGIDGPRRSTRNRGSSQSSSEYFESEKSMMDEDDHPPVSAESPESPPPATFVKSQRGRTVKLAQYRESSDDEVNKIFRDDEDVELVNSHIDAMDGDDEDDEDQPRRKTRSSSKRSSINDDMASNRRVLRNRNKNPPPPPTTSSGRITRQPKRYEPSNNPAKRLTRAQSKAAAEMDDGYIDEPSDGSADADGSLDDAPRTSSDNDLDAEGEVDLDGEVEHDIQDLQPDGRPYSLRQRAPINYAIPPALEEMKQAKPRPAGGRGGGNRRRGPGWSASGAELSRWMGMAPADDSDSDFPTRTPRKPFGGAGVFGAGGPVSAGGAGLLPGDLAAAAGTPSNLGKIGDAALADADPLGVNTNVTFDEVGGLDDHIHSLKEMTILPLLYPEVFQRFNLTPPRGVLFHGPPGTGKTLLARALAASCRANGKGVSFFMRKGADCLSKWVGEAERQLRLLFEEARNCQPSIIFFDEIDGLAPVRSSKQDQIHASIVSTLLALMDGMDGRGQVIVIGATNRPDAIDPALRRPGRFDREFYFPLPSLEARERILTIMTKDWEGWQDGQGAENIKGLAKFTKGYGGADLRALCTEAALNAIQRRYPQIYQSSDRLLLKPETIGVTFRDFMISIKKLVPSSARSSSSSASPLPTQLAPLLSDTLEKVKDAINRVLPVSKKRTALEEAMWEEDSEAHALDRELFIQSMETLRVYRPRLVLHGPAGMGQGYLGAAALHHLEGYHVQTLDLGTLMGDSTRTVEAAVVQLFVEAKRHQPSVIYLPSLDGWSAAVSETARSTVRSMLDSLAPTDPVLVLAIVDGPFSSLPRDVRSWFGMTRENRLTLPSPTEAQREAFFSSIIADIRRPPNQFADGIKRRKRILEELPIAPPLEPRQPTAAELAVQEENDQRVITLLKYRLGPILTELKRKFKRFTKKAREEYDFDPIPVVNEVEIIATTVTVQAENDVVDICEQATQEQPNGIVNGIHPDPEPIEHPEPPEQPQPQLFDMDLERMHVDLYKGKYLTPHDFLEDINKIVFNAAARAHQDSTGDRLYRAQAMLTAAEVSIQDFDAQFKHECQRMAERERKRREEHKKAKGKGRAGEDAQNGAAAPRRSARHNGQQLEITITDPLQLERRLKRARSTERHSGSPESGNDKPEEPSTPRNSKRQRTITSDDDHDPMDIIGASRAQIKGSAVRFANDVQPPPESDVLPVYGVPTAIDSLSNSNAMAVDSPSPRKPAGFDPMLLNPMSPDGGFPATSISHLLNGAIPSTVPVQDGCTPPPAPLLSPAIGVAFLNPLIPPPRTPSPLATRSLTPAADIIQEQPMVVVPPVEIERTPTPLPDFHVDEHLLSTLQSDLCSSTAQLSVELLEQLRAAALGCIWRHRVDWDRGELIREMKDILKEFLDDFAAGGDDPDSP